MASSNKLLNDAEIVQILQNWAKSKKVSVNHWTLKEMGGKLKGFLGGYFCLKIEALIVGRSLKIT